jgi:hypothetical protein
MNFQTIPDHKIYIKDDSHATGGKGLTIRSCMRLSMMCPHVFKSTGWDLNSRVCDLDSVEAKKKKGGYEFEISSMDILLLPC